MRVFQWRNTSDSIVYIRYRNVDHNFIHTIRTQIAPGFQAHTQAHTHTYAQTHTQERWLIFTKLLCTNGRIFRNRLHEHDDDDAHGIVVYMLNVFATRRNNRQSGSRIFQWWTRSIGWFRRPSRQGRRPKIIYLHYSYRVCVCAR